MIKVNCQLPKEVIFLECTRYPSLEALSTTIATIIRTGEPMILRWAEGIVFSYSLLLPTTESVMKEFVNGRIYWDSVIYASMPKFKPIIPMGTLDIPVVDVTPNPTLKAVAKWMRAHDKNMGEE